MLVLGKNRNSTSGLTLIFSNYQPKDAGPAAKNLGEDGEEY
jgi:hypothetical protein